MNVKKMLQNRVETDILFSSVFVKECLFVFLHAFTKSTIKKTQCKTRN